MLTVSPPSTTFLICSKRKVKRRALIWLPFGRNAAAVAVNDSLHRGKANPSSGELASVVQALKGTKQFSAVSRIEAGAIVAHEVLLFAVLVRYA